MKMKALYVLTILVVCVLFGCRNSEAETQETEQAIKKIEAIESKVDSTQYHLDQTSKALRDAINELDSL